MMSVENPVLSLKNLNDLESKILNKNETARDYEEIDFFISSIGGEITFIKTILLQNGFNNFFEYVKERHSKSSNRISSISKIHGAVLGALSFLKSYAIKNKFY